MCKQQAALFQVQRNDGNGTAAALLIPGELEVQGQREHAGGGVYVVCAPWYKGSRHTKEMHGSRGSRQELG